MTELSFEQILTEWAPFVVSQSEALDCWSRAIAQFQRDDYESETTAAKLFAVAVATDVVNPFNESEEALKTALYAMLYGALSVPPDGRTFASELQRVCRLALGVIRERGWQPRRFGGDGGSVDIERVLSLPPNVFLLSTALGSTDAQFGVLTLETFFGVGDGGPRATHAEERLAAEWIGLPTWEQRWAFLRERADDLTAPGVQTSVAGAASFALGRSDVPAMAYLLLRRTVEGGLEHAIEEHQLLCRTSEALADPSADLDQYFTAIDHMAELIDRRPTARWLTDDLERYAMARVEAWEASADIDLVAAADDFVQSVRTALQTDDGPQIARMFLLERPPLAFVERALRAIPTMRARAASILIGDDRPDLALLLVEATFAPSVRRRLVAAELATAGELDYEREVAWLRRTELGLGYVAAGAERSEEPIDLPDLLDDRDRVAAHCDLHGGDHGRLAVWNPASAPPRTGLVYFLFDHGESGGPYALRVRDGELAKWAMSLDDWFGIFADSALGHAIFDRSGTALQGQIERISRCFSDLFDDEFLAAVDEVVLIADEHFQPLPLHLVQLPDATFLVDRVTVRYGLSGELAVTTDPRFLDIGGYAALSSGSATRPLGRSDPDNALVFAAAELDVCALIGLDPREADTSDELAEWFERSHRYHLADHGSVRPDHTGGRVGASPDVELTLLDMAAAPTRLTRGEAVILACSVGAPALPLAGRQTRDFVPTLGACCRKAGFRQVISAMWPLADVVGFVFTVLLVQEIDRSRTTGSDDLNEAFARALRRLKSERQADLVGAVRQIAGAAQLGAARSETVRAAAVRLERELRSKRLPDIPFAHPVHWGPLKITS